MVIRVNPNVSPRIITVPESDGTTITIQNLTNQLRDWEQEPAHLSYPRILYSSGKENLGALSTGIVARLLNAKLKFEDRAGPSWVQCTVSGGTLVAVDENGDSMVAIEGSDYVTALVLNEVGGVIAVTGSGITEQDKLDIADRVWDEDKIDHSATGSMGKSVSDIETETDKIPDVQTKVTDAQRTIAERMKIDGSVMTIYESDGTTVHQQYQLLDADGNPTSDLSEVRERVPI